MKEIDSYASELYRDSFISFESQNLPFLKTILLFFPIVFLKLSPILDIAIFVAIVAFLFWKMKSDYFFLFFFILSIFGDVFDFNYLDGSFSRIYQFLFFFKVIFMKFLSPSRKELSFRFIPTSTFFIIVYFVASSVIYTHSISDLISNIVNGAILFYIGQLIINKDGFLEKIFVITCFSAIASGLYGVVHNNFLQDRGMVRLYGAIADPNYSCFVYLLGFASLLSIRKISRSLKIGLSFILLFFCVLAVSVSGIVGYCLIFLAYSFFNNRKRTIYLVLFFALSIIIVFILGQKYPSSPLGVVTNRINVVLTQISNNDLSGATSLRSSLVTKYYSYFKGLPVKNIFFGGINTVSGQNRDYFMSLFYHVSHNSFIDMLFMLGYMGTAVFIVYFLIKMYKTFKAYVQNNDYNSMGLFFILIVCIYYMFSISIFPYRFFYSFALLEFEAKKRIIPVVNNNRIERGPNAHCLVG